MTTKPKPIPEGYHTATPYLIITNAAKAIEFYKEVFAATELDRLATPDGKVGHAEIQIGDSRIMLADEFPEWDARSPKTIGGSPVVINVGELGELSIRRLALLAVSGTLRPCERVDSGSSR